MTWHPRHELTASAIAAAALAAGIGAARLWSSGHLHGARGGGMFAALGVTLALAFVGAGLAARSRRPASRVGALMIAAGFAWTGTSLKYATGWPGAAIGSTLWAGIVLHLVLAFPTGRLGGRPARVVVVAGYVAVTVLQVLPRVCGGEQRAALKAIQLAVIAAVVCSALILLVHRRRRASAAERRSLAPVLWCGGVTLILAAVRKAAPAGAEAIASWAMLAALGSVPFALLAGLFRSRMSALDGVGRLVRRMRELPGPLQLRDALAQALGDPGLGLAYWVPERERFVDAGGRPVALPGDDSGRAVARIGGPQPIAAIVYDAALDPDAVHAAGAAVALWLDRERLEAELRARLAELRDSRARLVEAGDAERRRIERDLHDGAQQRIASLLLHLELERRALGPGPAAEALDGVSAGLADALAELRSLAAGILPPVLTDRGLAAAVEDLAGRASLAVEIESMPRERLPDRVEVAAYFLVAEGLANVAKHAGARRVAVRVTRAGAHAIVEVRDDGRGGADERHGSGLRGLADRVGALDGRLECHSPPRGGTLLRAEIPCAS